jgi:hypothetical protein
MFERRRHRFVYRDVDRHGNVRLYFRRTDSSRKVRMPDDPSSEELLVRYKELLGSAAGQVTGVQQDATTVAGAYGWLVRQAHAGQAPPAA